MRGSALSLVLAAFIAGCGGSSMPQRNEHATTTRSTSAGGSYVVQVAERPAPVSNRAGATSFRIRYGFAYNEPKLTKSQAIQQAAAVAHRSSPVVRDVTCRQVPSGWRCEYTGQMAGS